MLRYLTCVKKTLQVDPWLSAGLPIPAGDVDSHDFPSEVASPDAADEMYQPGVAASKILKPRVDVGQVVLVFA